MENVKIILDKNYIKKHIFKELIFSTLDIAVIMLFIPVLFSKNYRTLPFVIGMIVVLNIIKAIMILNQQRNIDEEEFFILKAAVAEKRIDDGDDSISYYLKFWCGVELGAREMSVSKKKYSNYNVGDYFYVLFLINKKRKKNLKYCFPTDVFAIDSELKRFCSQVYYYGNEVITDSKETVIKYNYVDIQNQVDNLSDSEKEHLLSVDKKISSMKKLMLISGILLFVLFVIFLATINMLILIPILIAGAVFFFGLTRMAAICDKYPEYDALECYILKQSKRNRKIDEEDKIHNESEKKNKSLINKEAKPNKIKGLFLAVRRLLAIVILLFSLTMIMTNLVIGASGEDIAFILFFVGATIISFLMICTKLRFLSLLYVADFLAFSLAFGVIEGKSAGLIITFTVMTMLFILPVIIINLKRK